MSIVRRAAVVLSAVLLAWPLSLILAQPTPSAPAAPPAAEPPRPLSDDGFAPPSDSRLHVKLDAAVEYIHDEEWGKAVRVLQQLLDLDDDRTAVIGDDGRQRIVSARAEAQRLLASLPPAGRKAYQEAQGERAAEMVKAAIKDKDDVKLVSIVRRFQYTYSGPEALEALAVLHYDAGRYRLAALGFQRLLERSDPAKWSPEDLFRAADACHRIRDRTHADLVGKLLLDRLGDKSILIGDRKLSRDDVQKELSQPVEANTDWPMFGGDSSRSAQGDGGMPFLWREWEEPTTVPFADISNVDELSQFGAKLADLFKRASDKLTAVKQPVLPPQFPVTASVTLKRNGKNHSVVVYRTHAGIAVRDMANGKVIGYSPIDGSLEWMTEIAQGNVLQQWEQTYLGVTNQRPGIFFENTTIGTLSIDGDFAYTVADLAVPKPPNYRMTNLGAPNQFNWPKDIVKAISQNRLTAFDLSSGCKSAWTADYFDPESMNAIPELSGCFFLGPPLPLDGRLFVLSEKEQELRLICLENVKGDAPNTWKPKVDFVLSLSVCDSTLENDALRRVNAAHLSYDDGVLVCPTNFGRLIGIDLLQKSVLWVYPYRDKTDAAGAGLPPGVIRVLPGGIMIGANGQQIVSGRPQQGWRACAPIIQDGMIVFTAPDGAALTCLDLKTGAPRWKEARQDEDLYLAGVIDGRVLVVGKKTCRAYNLSDGKPLWTVSTGVPSGQGAAAGGVYYLPLRETEASKEPEVCAIDVAKGRIIGRARRHVPDEVKERAEPYGNLVFAGGAVISQTTESITLYPLLKTKLEEINAALAKNPDDAEGLFARAELRLEGGKAADAVDDLHRVLDGKPSAELLQQARGVLYPALTQLLQTDFTKAEKYLKEYEELCHVTNDGAETLRRRAVLYLLSGRGFEGEGKLKEALAAYAELAGLGDEPLLASPDDPALRSSPSALGKAAIGELLKKAPAEKRKELEDEVRRVLDKAKESKGDDDLHSFIAAFGPESDAGREARLELAERLIAKEDGGREAEVVLAQVRAGGDTVQAARAVEALARLSTKLGLLDDALCYYGVLNRDYGATKVRGGKTGAELYKEVQTDKRFLPLLDKKPRLFDERDR